VIDGVLKAGMKVKMMNAGATHQVDRIGVFKPKQTEVAELGPGEIGYHHRPDQAGGRRRRRRHHHRGKAPPPSRP